MEMNNTAKSRLLNFLIPVGILLFGIGAIASYTNSTPKTVMIISTVFLIVQIVFGFIIVLVGCRQTKKATHIFIGLVFFIWGILHGVLNFIPEASIKQWWPVYAVIAGIVLFVSGFFKYRKIKFGYALPAVFLFLMGIWYSLFSFKIITKSFSSVIATIGPFFILALALSLIIFFLVQQKHRELILPDDETGTFSDEE